MKYFEGLTTESEIKARYKELAKAHHPDRGGCAETMKIINSQYEKVITGQYQKAGKSITEIEELLANDAALRATLDSIIMLDGLHVEICGSWLWVTGETRLHKDGLKAAGFFWSQSKGAWYWRSAGKRSFNRKPLALDEIRYKHGAITIPRQSRVLVA